MERKDHQGPETVAPLARNYARGAEIGQHAHDSGQLIFARSGVMRVTADRGLFLVPPARALWMPARMVHAIDCRTDVAMRTVYVARDVADPFGGRCAVIDVSPLMREIVLRLVEGAAEGSAETPAYRAARPHLVALLLLELEAGRVEPLHLPEPADARLTRVTAALRADPASRDGPAHWAALAGMADRSFARRFAAETGLPLSAWRRRARMLRAIERLAAGVPVTEVALDTGYDSLSAFIHAFRREFGRTPGRYFGGGGNDDD